MILLARGCTSLALIVLVTYVLTHGPRWALSVLVSSFISMALFEFYTMIKRKGLLVYRFSGVIIGTIIPIVVHLQLGQTRSGEVLFLVLACFGLFLVQFPRKDNPTAIEAISITLFGMMYISWFLSFLIRLNYLPQGSVLVGFLLIVTKGSDVAAYIVGSLIGRHSLIPHISPKKSVEGFLAAVVTSAVLATFFYAILPLNLTLGQLALMGGLLGVLAQCGDLSESIIKRYCGAKDSGQIIPGLGGSLDLVDSVLFTTPIFYFYVLSHT